MFVEEWLSVAFGVFPRRQFHNLAFQCPKENRFVFVLICFILLPCKTWYIFISDSDVTMLRKGVLARRWNPERSTRGRNVGQLCFWLVFYLSVFHAVDGPHKNRMKMFLSFRTAYLLAASLENKSLPEKEGIFLFMSVFWRLQVMAT